MPAFSSFMLGLGALAGLAGTGASILQGQQAQKAQDQSLAAQETAGLRAKQVAKDTRTANQMEMNKAEQKAPDVRSILERAYKKDKNGTLLTGNTGVSASDLTLGKMATTLGA